eukprot:6197264-Pleurochrysis_carterae.AAC.1
MSPLVSSAPCVRGGVVSGLVAIHSHGGVRALFQGNGANVIKSSETRASHSERLRESRRKAKCGE